MEEIEEAKKRIKDIFWLIGLLNGQLDDIVDEHIGLGIPVPNHKGLYDNAQWFSVSTEWDCPVSPFGWCMYHIIHDKAKDNCVFCHKPKERK